MEISEDFGKIRCRKPAPENPENDRFLASKNRVFSSFFKSYFFQKSWNFFKYGIFPYESYFQNRQKSGGKGVPFEAPFLTIF